MVRLRTSRMERKEAEAGFELSPQGHGGDVRRFLKGELVEVRQREKGLRGSWHPAVVIDVKSGRRVVEYDQLLTDDRRRKLTEHIPVDRCLDAVRFGVTRQTGKSPSKRPRTLLRPRPPPLPGPAAIRWSKGLSVDCYFKDAWWEGILTEAVYSSKRQKKALVWFPEEEDWEEMPLKCMRVGQQWHEDTGEWSLKGYVEIPFSKRGKRPKTMSLSQKSRGFGSDRRGRVRDGMKLSIALKIDGSNNSKMGEDYNGVWNSVDRSTGDPGAMISVQLNSPRNASSEPHQRGTADRAPGDSWKESRALPLALRSRILEFPQPLNARSPRMRTRGDPSLCASPSLSEDKDNVASFRNGEAAGLVRDDYIGTIDQFRLTSGHTVDKENLDGVELTIYREWGRIRMENGNAVIDEAGKMGQQVIEPNLSPAEERGVKKLIASGWNIIRKSRSGKGKMEWHYKSPNGCVLGSLSSALGMSKRMEAYKNTCGDEENPTLSDIILSPKSRTGRMFKTCRRVGSPSSVKEGGHELDQPDSIIRVDVNGFIVSKSEALGEGRITEDVNGYIDSKPGALTAGNVIREDVKAYIVSITGALVENNGIRKSPDTGSAVPPLSSPSNCKRNASESEVIVDVGKLDHMKRRKVSDPPAEQNETRISQAFPSYGGPDDGPVDSAVGGVPLETTPLTDGKPLGKGSDDGPATETRSKKRAYLTEGVIRDQGNDLFNARSSGDKSPVPDESMEFEPKSKKSRVMIEVSCSSQGKSRKSLAILQESSRKKGSTPHKSADSKSAKKGSTQVKKTPSHAKKSKKSRTPSRSGVRLEVLLSAPGSKIEGEGGELTRKRTLLSWLIDNGTVFENEKVRYLHRKDLHCMLKGSVTRDGILCDCCNKVVTLSVFEAHAGSKLHRPSANIFLEDGRSLSVCQVEALAVKTQSEVEGQTDFGVGLLVDKSDDTCGICGDGGELICCDHCPSTFHITCMGLQEVPDGDWYCPNCRCASCGGSQFNGDQSTFNDLTVILCDQCECEYHVKCLRDRGLSLTAVPQNDFFCQESCERIFLGLRRLVGICKPMEHGFSSTLLRSGAEDDRKSGCLSNTELNVEHDSKLSIALSVMQECFRPMIDPRTKIDIITHVLYNRRSDVSRLNYHGFFTMLLERGDELISVASIRIHGARLAEMPLIGTRFQYRRQGMCRRLMSAIEEMLHSLGVERLVLPAVPELLETWTGPFGFQPMDESEKLQLMDCNIMAFPGTSILYKRLDTLKPRQAVALPPNADQLRCAESQPRESDAALASSPAIVKRRPGRPPKLKRAMNNWTNGLALPEAIVGAHSLRKSGSTARPSDSAVASECVIVKRGPGRPPKNSKPQLAVSTALVEPGELAETGSDAGYPYSLTDGFLGKASVRMTQILTDGAEQDKEQLPTVVRRKRGRPPRARISYNPSNGTMPATATSIQVDQVARFHGGRIQVSTSTREQVIEASRAFFPKRLPDGTRDGRFSSIQATRGGFNYSNSAVVPITAPAMREMKSTPMWLVESVHEEVQLDSRKALAREGIHKALLPETDILPIVSYITGNTRTYERRKSCPSPQSDGDTPSRTEDDGSDGEPTAGRVDIFYEDDDHQPASERSFSYEPVSVPIRTFPSQFSARGEHNAPPGAYIPVETIVVNSSSNVETFDEALVPESIQTSYSERGEQKCGGKLLLRLKLPKKNMSTEAACDSGSSEPSPTASVQLSNGELLPSTFTVTEQISKEVNRFEQCDTEELKKSKPAMGSPVYSS